MSGLYDIAEMITRQANIASRAGQSAALEQIAQDCRELADKLDAASGALVLAGLAILRHIPNGELRSGCVVSDGEKLRDNLRSAVNAVRDLSKVSP